MPPDPDKSPEVQNDSASSAVIWLTLFRNDCSVNFSLCTQLQEVRDAEDGGKGPRRQRNSALTWEVPPALDAQSAVAAGSPADGPAPSQPVSSPAAVGRAAVHPLVALHREAFQNAADSHLRAVVRQLLGAEEPAVGPLSISPILAEV